MADDKQETRLDERGQTEGKTGQQGNQAGGKKRKLPSNCLPAGDHESAEKPKISMNLVRPNDKKGTGVSLKLGSDPKKQKTEPVILAKKGTVASAFNDESDDDEEEMPAEAKMRMRNIGRGTPTSAGPNSFNKGSGGFTDHRKAMEKSFKIQHPTRSKEVKE